MSKSNESSIRNNKSSNSSGKRNGNKKSYFQLCAKILQITMDVFHLATQIDASIILSLLLIECETKIK